MIEFIVSLVEGTDSGLSKVLLRVSDTNLYILQLLIRKKTKEVLLTYLAESTHVTNLTNKTPYQPSKNKSKDEVPTLEIRKFSSVFLWHASRTDGWPRFGYQCTKKQFITLMGYCKM